MNLRDIESARNLAHLIYQHQQERGVTMKPIKVVRTAILATPDASFNKDDFDKLLGIFKADLDYVKNREK